MSLVDNQALRSVEFKFIGEPTLSHWAIEFLIGELQQSGREFTVERASAELDKLIRDALWWKRELRQAKNVALDPD